MPVSKTFAGVTYSLPLSGEISWGSDVTSFFVSIADNAAVKGSIVNNDIASGAAIVDTKLATISTAGKVSNSATTATDANTASAIVARDASGNFSAGTITANLTGNVSGSAASFTGSLSGDVTGTQGSTAISSSTVTGKLITGFSSTTGALAGTDTILQAINKLDGNIGTKEPAITTLAASKGGLATDASAFTGVLKASSGVFSASSLVNADVSATAAIARSKLATGTAGYVVINNPSGGAFSEEQYLDKTRGGTGITSTATFPSSGVIVTEASSSTLTNKTLTGVVITDYEDLTHISTPTSPASGKLRFYAKADNKLYVKDSGGTEAVVGSGSGSGTKNYLSRYFAGDAVVGTVSTVAVDGSISVSGSFPDVTSAWYADTTSGAAAIAENSDNTLRGTSNYLTALSGESTSGGRFVQTPAFNIDGEDLGKALTVQFDVAGNTLDDDWDVVAVRYNSSGTFQELIPIAGNVSTTTGTASAKIPTGTTQFNGFFITSNTANDVYSIRFRRRKNSSAIRLDSLLVGPNAVLQGAVITDWVSYTPTYTGLGTVTTTFAQYRRVGSNIEIEGRISIGTPTAVTAKISLPSGLTTSISTTSALVGYGTRSTAGAVDYYLLAGTTSSDSVGIGRTSASEAGFSRLDGSTLFSGTEEFGFFASIPISQWQANTQMAARAVEEYASNGGAAGNSSNDTTDFKYGASGSLIGSISAALNRRVRFQTPIMPTDRLSVEVSNDGKIWNELTGLKVVGGSGITLYQIQNTVSYGMGIYNIVSSTDVDVRFGTYEQPSGATYAANGEAWRAGGSDQYWRVRKVSGGAAVGYPVGARNVVGDTTGTTVPAGYIGEKTSTTSFSVTVNASTPANLATLTPGAGVWLISVNCRISSNATGRRGLVSISTTSATEDTTFRASSITYETGDIGTSVFVNRLVELASGASVYVVGNAVTGAISANGNVFAVRIA